MDFLTEMKADGKIKNVVQIDKDFLGDANLKSQFSGWYLPSENTLIYFGFAMHTVFMTNYWPARQGWLPQDGEKQDKSYYINKTDKKFNNIVKKYKKALLKTYKGELHADYSDFYKLGWMRVNLYHNELTLTYWNGNQTAAKNFLIWAVREKLKIKMTTVHDTNSNDTTYLSKEQLENVANNPDAVAGADVIDKVRTRMFGPGVYTDEKITFMAFINYLLSEGI